MAVKTVDIALSEFEQGGFYVGSSSGNDEYSSETEVRAQPVLISGIFDTGNIISITVLSVGNDWSFVGLTSTNSFVFISAALGYKTSGTVIDISSYNTVRKIRIELHRENGISPPQEAILRVVYEDGVMWKMEGDYPVPTKSLPVPDGSFTKPYPASLWRIDESNDSLPYNELMPDILYRDPIPPPEPDNPERANWLSHWFIRLGDIDTNRKSVMGYISQKANRTFQPANFKNSPHWNSSVQELNDTYYKMLGIDSVGGLIEWNYIEGGET